MGRVADYIKEEHWDHLDEQTKLRVKEAMADLVAAMIAGAGTEIAQITKKVALQQWSRGNSSIMLTSTKLQPIGAAMVNATMANALDIDDGHRLTKGHPGAVVIPAVLAAAEEAEATGKEFLSALIVAYEVGIRAGILAHQFRPEYHCTGSWGALGAAAGVSRLLGLETSQVEHALGVAEYHSTYSPMMRGIDHPSMVKDAIGWGCMTGTSAAYLAKEGFTGIPSLFSMKPAEALVNELGKIYRINHLYEKSHACCRWAQPGVEGIKYLLETHDLSSQMVDQVVIHTFDESAKLSRDYPGNTEEAQYNIAFPVAAYMCCGEVGPKQVLKHLSDPQILGFMDRIKIEVDQEIDSFFPGKALSRVEVLTADGKHYKSPIMQAKGDFDYPLTAIEKQEKFHWLTAPLLGDEKTGELHQQLHSIDEVKNIRELFQRLVL